MVAYSKEQSSGRDGSKEERLLRLFLVVGKEVTTKLELELEKRRKQQQDGDQG